MVKKLARLGPQIGLVTKGLREERLRRQVDRVQRLATVTWSCLAVASVDHQRRKSRLVDSSAPAEKRC
jgi:hypothetical protein